METPKKILVPTDFSPASKEAASYALRLAEVFGATIKLVHVWDYPLYMDSQIMLHATDGSTQSIIQYVKDQAKKSLSEMVEALKNEKGIEIGQEFATGKTHKRILQEVKDEGFDLIVMGTHGRSGISHFFLGSIAEKVIREATCPVVTIRPKE